MTDFQDRELMDGSVDIHNNVELFELLNEVLPYLDEISTITITVCKTGFNVLVEEAYP